MRYLTVLIRAGNRGVLAVASSAAAPWRRFDGPSMWCILYCVFYVAQSTRCTRHPRGARGRAPSERPIRLPSVRFSRSAHGRAPGEKPTHPPSTTRSRDAHGRALGQSSPTNPFDKAEPLQTLSGELYVSIVFASLGPCVLYRGRPGRFVAVSGSLGSARGCHGRYLCYLAPLRCRMLLLLEQLRGPLERFGIIRSLLGGDPGYLGPAWAPRAHAGALPFESCCAGGCDGRYELDDVIP